MATESVATPLEALVTVADKAMHEAVVSLDAANNARILAGMILAGLGKAKEADTREALDWLRVSLGSLANDIDVMREDLENAVRAVRMAGVQA